MQFVLEVRILEGERRARRLNPPQIIALGFLVVILIGGLLLSLPVSSADGERLPFENALFTATSAVCVTGLVTIVPAEQFTLLGKIILLLLIQVGGLGVIACMSAFFPSFSLYFHYSQYTNLFLQMQENYKNVTISLYFRNFS